MHIRTYMHVCIHIYIYIYIHRVIGVHPETHTLIWTQTRVDTNTHRHMYIHVCVHVYIHMWMHACSANSKFAFRNIKAQSIMFQAWDKPPEIPNRCLWYTLRFKVRFPIRNAVKLNIAMTLLLSYALPIYLHTWIRAHVYIYIHKHAHNTRQDETLHNTRLQYECVCTRICICALTMQERYIQWLLSWSQADPLF